MRIANNVGSLIAQNRLFQSSSAMGKSLEKLSTGFKVNRGADGPAALVISEKQRAQIAGIEQAIENTDKAVSVVQTAEGALNEVNSLLVKIRSLALDSANSGVNDADALAANQEEIDNALDTISRIANSTQFSTKKLLNGEAGVIATAGDTDVTASGTVDTADGNYAITVDTAAARASATFTQTADLTADETLTINGVAITIDSGSTQAEVAARINAFTDQTGVTAEIDGADTRLRTDTFGSAATIEVTTDGTGAAGSTQISPVTGIDVSGTDVQVSVTQDGAAVGSFTGEGATFTVDAGDAKGLSATFALADTVSTVTGAQGTVTIENNSLTFQIGANAQQNASIAISNVDADSLGLTGLNIESEESAQAAIDLVDAAIDQVTNERGELGAFQQNTLESTANNLRTSLENSVNAESVIRDTNYAQEIAEFTTQQVLVQAGTSLLGSANQTSQLVLSLL